MGWSEASLSPEEPLHLTVGSGGRGGRGASSRYEGEEAIVIKRAKKKDIKEKQMGKIKIFAWFVAS